MTSANAQSPDTRAPELTLSFHRAKPAVANSITMIALALVILPACAPTPPPLQGAILIVLDTVRADRVSAYGHTRATTPNLDALARDGVLFEQAISAAPWTLPSFAALMTGRFPHERSGRHRDQTRITDSLVKVFRRAGYRTGAFTEGGYVSQAFGLGQGFATYQEEEGPVKFRRPGQQLESKAEGSIDRTFDAATAWLETLQGEKFFLLIHTYEPHTPYRRHRFTEGYGRAPIGDTLEIPSLVHVRRGELGNDNAQREYVGALYDSGLYEADQHVGAFLAGLARMGLRDRTLLVVTSDHGEELGDRYPTRLAHHGHALTDDQLRVPLIISDPSQEYAVDRVDQTVRTVDILPTIADRLDTPIQKQIDGRTLVPLMQGKDDRHRIASGGATSSGPARSFIRTHRWKYIEVTDAGDGKLTPMPSRHQLYDLEADPGEDNNIAERHPDVVDRLAKMLRSAETEVPPNSDPADVPSELEDRLRSLGYVE